MSGLVKITVIPTPDILLELFSNEKMTHMVNEAIAYHIDEDGPQGPDFDMDDWLAIPMPDRQALVNEYFLHTWNFNHDDFTEAGSATDELYKEQMGIVIKHTKKYWRYE